MMLRYDTPLRILRVMKLNVAMVVLSFVLERYCCMSHVQ